MKCTITTTIALSLASVALAIPTSFTAPDTDPDALAMAIYQAMEQSMSEAESGVQGRQSSDVGITENEFTSGGCKPIIFLWARGSTEGGNMGSVIGQPLGTLLKKKYGNDIAIQGIVYPALLSTNALPGGADPNDVNVMKSLLVKAAACPNSVIVTGGYSQGAALNHRAIENQSADIKAKIAGVVTFGDTQAAKDKGQIPNFSPDKTKIICASNPRDTVCDGVLTAAVLAPHLSYGQNAPEAFEFLQGKISAAQVA